MSTNIDDATVSGFYSWTDTLKGVYYGPGSVKTALPKLLKKLGGSKVLIVTGKSLKENRKVEGVPSIDVINSIETILKDLGVYGATFSDIGQHAPVAGIHVGIQLLKDVKADVIVSVGGGSPIDASKVMISLLQEETGGEFLKQIAIPTTLSAAEYAYVAGYKNEQGAKVGIGGEKLAPAGIILDAELTLSTPVWLWLSTGIRALDHAVENLYRPSIPYPLKVLGYGAIADLFKYLPASKEDPTDLDARTRLQLASWMSLWPIKMENPVSQGLSHDIGRGLGATYSIPHGITSCITLAPVVALKGEIASDEHKKALAKALLFLEKPSSGSVDNDIQQLSSEISQLVNTLGLSTDLTHYKVPKGDVSKIASHSLAGATSGPLYERVVKLVEGLY